MKKGGKKAEDSDDFMQVCHDDSKFGGKSISSPVKSIEVSEKIMCVGYLTLSHRINGYWYRRT